MLGIPRERAVNMLMALLEGIRLNSSEVELVWAKLPPKHRTRKSHCVRGHERTAQNVRKNGECRACMRLRMRLLRANLPGLHRVSRYTPCICGHSYALHAPECYHRAKSPSFAYDCECAVFRMDKQLGVAMRRLVADEESG